MFFTEFQQELCETSVLDAVVLLSLSLLLGMMIGIVLVGWSNRNEKTYMEGQVDAINGVINYELVKQQNGEMKWQRVVPEDHFMEDEN